MKKHDEGYALVLVLVVMVVVCLVAVSIMTASVENLQAQQKSVARMQDKYEAQGKIEQVLVLAEQQFANYAGYTVTLLEDACAGVGGVEFDGEFVYTKDTAEVAGETKKLDTLSFRLAAQEGSVQIRCTVVITGDIDKGMENSLESYIIKDYTIGYSSYEIVSDPSAEGGAAQ